MDSFLEVLSLAEGKKIPPHIDEKGWKSIVTEARYHSLAGYLSDKLKIKKAEVSPKIFESLSNAYAPMWRDSLAYLTILETVVNLFAAEGIDLIVLKGPHVAQEVYGSFKERPMSDLDVLVKKTDFRRAHGIMKKISVTENWNITWIERYHYHYGYTVSEKIGSGAKRLKVEVHWDLLPPENPFLLNIDEFWSDAKNVQIGNVKTKVLSSERLLLYLCLHIAFQHVFHVKLLHFLDIALILKSVKIDWQVFSRISEDARALKAVGLVMKTVNTIFGIEFPEELSKIVQKSSIGQDTLDDALFFALGKHETFHTSYSRFKKKSGLLGNVVSLFFSIFPNPKDIIEMGEIQTPFPDVILAYVFRFIDLFKKRFFPFAEIYMDRKAFSRFKVIEKTKDRIIDKISRAG